MIRIHNPDPDPRRQKCTPKTGTVNKFLCFEVLDVLFGGLKASPAAWRSLMEA
jgi:hypothetical protein